MKLKGIFFILILALGINACKTIKTQAPEASYVPVSLKPELSVIQVPFEIQVSKLESLINSYVKGVLYEDNNLNDDDLMLKVTKLRDIKLEVNGENFNYKVPLSIWVKAGFKAEKFGITVSDYEETSCELIIEFQSKIKLNPDWSTTITTKLKSYEWIKKPSIDWGLIKIPITSIADKVIESQQEKLVPLLDQQTAKYLQIKEYVAPAWSKIQEPFKITSNPVTCICIEPSEVQVSPFVGRAGLVQSSVNIKAYINYKIGNVPTVTAKPLPGLKVSNVESGFITISLLTDIDYPTAEKMAKEYFEGTVYEFKNGKKKVKVDEVKLYGKDGKLIIGLQLSGSLKGKIFLTGIPYYDPTDKSIKVKELDFELNTKNQIAKSANWLAHGALLKRIQGTMNFPLKQELASVEANFQKNFSHYKINEYVLLDGRIISLVPDRIVLTQDGIAALVNMKGTLSVELLK